MPAAAFVSFGLFTLEAAGSKRADYPITSNIKNIYKWDTPNIRDLRS